MGMLKIALSSTGADRADAWCVQGVVQGTHQRGEAARGHQVAGGEDHLPGHPHVNSHQKHISVFHTTPS